MYPEGSTFEDPWIYVNILPFEETYFKVSIKELSTIPEFVEQLAIFFITLFLNI